MMRALATFFFSRDKVAHSARAPPAHGPQSARGMAQPSSPLSQQFNNTWAADAEYTAGGSFQKAMAFVAETLTGILAQAAGNDGAANHLAAEDDFSGYRGVVVKWENDNDNDVLSVTLGDGVYNVLSVPHDHVINTIVEGPSEAYIIFVQSLIDRVASAIIKVVVYKEVPGPTFTTSAMHARALFDLLCFVVVPTAFHQRCQNLDPILSALVYDPTTGDPNESKIVQYRDAAQAVCNTGDSNDRTNYLQKLWAQLKGYGYNIAPGTSAPPPPRPPPPPSVTAAPQREDRKDKSIAELEYLFTVPLGKLINNVDLYSDTPVKLKIIKDPPGQEDIKNVTDRLAKYKDQLPSITKTETREQSNGRQTAVTQITPPPLAPNPMQPQITNNAQSGGAPPILTFDLKDIKNMRQAVLDYIDVMTRLWLDPIMMKLTSLTPADVLKTLDQLDLYDEDQQLEPIDNNQKDKLLSDVLRCVLFIQLEDLPPPQTDAQKLAALTYPRFTQEKFVSVVNRNKMTGSDKKQNLYLNFISESTDECVFAKHYLSAMATYMRDDVRNTETTEPLRIVPLFHMVKTHCMSGHIELMFRVVKALKANTRISMKLNNALLVSTQDMVLTYVKIRNSTNYRWNPRFHIIRQSDLADNTVLSDTMYVGYTAVTHALTWQDREADKVNHEHVYALGPFTRVFEAKDNNAYIAKGMVKVVERLLQKQPVFVMGYGASGAGKTSALIYFRDKDEPGVVLEVCKQLTDNGYDTIEVSGFEMYRKITGLKQSDVSRSLINSNNQTTLTFNYDATGQKFMLADSYTHKNEHVQRVKDITCVASTAPCDGVETQFTNEDHIGTVLTHLIDTDRHVKATTNNPNSSRSHVLVSLKFKMSNQAASNDDDPILIVGDFAGVENEFMCDSVEVLKAFLKAPVDGKPSEDFYSKFREENVDKACEIDGTCAEAEAGDEAETGETGEKTGETAAPGRAGTAAPEPLADVNDYGDPLYRVTNKCEVYRKMQGDVLYDFVGDGKDTVIPNRLQDKPHTDSIAFLQNRIPVDANRQSLTPIAIHKDIRETLGIDATKHLHTVLETSEYFNERNREFGNILAPLQAIVKPLDDGSTLPPHEVLRRLHDLANEERLKNGINDVVLISRPPMAKIPQVSLTLQDVIKTLRNLQELHDDLGQKGFGVSVSIIRPRYAPVDTFKANKRLYQLVEHTTIRSNRRLVTMLDGINAKYGIRGELDPFTYTDEYEIGMTDKPPVKPERADGKYGYYLIKQDPSNEMKQMLMDLEIEYNRTFDILSEYITDSNAAIFHNNTVLSDAQRQHGDDDKLWEHIFASMPLPDATIERVVSKVTTPGKYAYNPPPNTQFPLHINRLELESVKIDTDKMIQHMTFALNEYPALKPLKYVVGVAPVEMSNGASFVDYIKRICIKNPNPDGAKEAVKCLRVILQYMGYFTAETACRYDRIRKICNIRRQEGVFINQSLKDCRSVIRGILAAKGKGRLGTVPAFVDDCLPQYCDDLSCFSLSADTATKQASSSSPPASSVIFENVLRLLGNPSDPQEMLNKLVICVFCVLNISEGANNPPAVPYIDINNLKTLWRKTWSVRTSADDARTAAKNFVEASIALLQDKMTKSISDTKGVIKSVDSKGKYNHVAFKEFIDTDLLKQDQPVDKFWTAFADPKNKTLEYLTYRKAIAVEFMKAIDNSNEVSAIGTLQFIDAMAKFGTTSIVCDVKDIRGPQNKYEQSAMIIDD